MIQKSKYLVTLLILITAIGINFYYSKPESVISRKNLSEFPKTIGGWQVINEHQIDERSMKLLQADDYLMWDYKNSNGGIMALYVGYFKTQREGKSIHSPRQCLPGSGWNPVDTVVYQMPISDHNLKTVPVNKHVMGKGLDRQLFLFWYQGRGRIYAGEFWNKLYLIWDGFTKRRTDGALVRVNSSIMKNNSESLKEQLAFIKLVLPLLTEYVPN